MFDLSPTHAVALGTADTAPPASDPDGRPSGELEERELVARLRAGDADACEELVRAYAPRLSAVARRYLTCEADVEDAVQEAFISALAHIDRFQGDARLSTWLHRIVVNSALMSRRKRVRRREVGMDDQTPPASAAGRRGGCHPEDVGDRRATVAAAGRVLAEIRQLDPCHREVLELRHVLHQSTEQAGRALGMTPGALKTKLHRAKTHLVRRLLDGSAA